MMKRLLMWVPVVLTAGCGMNEVASVQLSAQSDDPHVRFIREVDQDGDQKLSLIEVERHVLRDLARQGRSLPPEQRVWIQLPFRLLDLDGDGFITLPELRQFRMTEDPFVAPRTKL